MVAMKKSISKTCAIYTRKSTDERLDMEFNTLDAQREACEAYIMSQRSEGWIASPEQYDDGGFSGGSLERPALNRLIEDIKAGKVNVIIVYKIDRLTRSLTDFSKLVEVFDEYGVTFVSITQSFNTTTSMGRLTLNVLLSFAQFEREVSGERIRDKIAASKAKGMWQGGRPPFGFDLGDRRLITNEEDAPQARQIFELYLQLGNVRAVKLELKKRGIKSRQRISEKGTRYGGAYFSRGTLYSLLQNPVYIGKISHKGEIHEGLHDAIIPIELWDAVQKQLKNQAQCPKGVIRTQNRNMLTGRIFDERDNPYTPVFTNKKNGKRYRYYTNKVLAENKDHPNYRRARFPAQEIEAVIGGAIRRELPHFACEPEDTSFNYLMKHQDTIPAYNLVRALATKVIVHHDALELHLYPSELEKLAQEHLGVVLNCTTEEAVINVPYQSERAQDGAVVIKSKDKDIFDLPPKALKKLVQGVIWRDEHFDGMAIKAIARRESCSHDYVSSAIFSSLKILQNAA
ncbi:MAG: recombinase family protein [Alphaproteobacteria bacterium]